MSKTTPIRTGRHVVFLLHAHLIFVTKYRRNVFNKQILAYLQLVFNDVCNSFDTQLVEFEGESDHVHLLINYPPKISLSKLVNALKGVSFLNSMFHNITGKMSFGHLAILLGHAAVLRCF